MLLFTATFDFAHISVLLLTSILMQKTKISETNIQGTYGNSREQLGSKYVLVVPAELSQTRAEVTCRNLRAEILTVEENMDLRKLMIEHEIESLWTSIYKSITTQTLVDENEYRPAVKTQFDEIDSQHLLATNLDNSKGVILRLKETAVLNSTKY